MYFKQRLEVWIDQIKLVKNGRDLEIDFATASNIVSDIINSKIQETRNYILERQTEADQKLAKAVENLAEATKRISQVIHTYDSSSASLTTSLDKIATAIKGG